jgi:tRNA(adenine34) deaminase
VEISEADAAWLRRSFEAARRAGERGNGAYGAILIDGDGDFLLEGENTAMTSGDVTGHAEINVVRRLSELPSGIDVSRCTLYASAEPCAMCAASIHHGGIGRLVFGVGAERMRAEREARGLERAPTLRLPCRDVLTHSEHAIEVVGPALEAEALAVHEEFWR